ncbi:MAG: S-adenosylmethionine decarboxylase [Trueperaceae bacterium]
MIRYEPLATGTALRLDGRRAGTEPLADPDALERLMHDLCDRLEPSDDPANRTRVRAHEADGSSHALLLDEAHLVLHAFPEVGAFAFAAFSRHAISDGALLDAVRAALRTGRFDSSVGRRAAGLPRDVDALARRMRGERAWARSRLLPRPDLD